MRISISNLQSTCRLKIPAIRRLTAWLLRKTQEMTPGQTWLDCSLVFVDHARMVELNRAALSHEGTTDVITFTYTSQPGEPEGLRGEIVVNVDEAVAVAARMNADTARELALYIAHGCQHLGGANDGTAAERSAMSRRQNRWLAEARRHGLLEKLIA